MYKIIGVDQKEYGPITDEQMRQWIKEGRVNAQTLVWSETSANWKPLSAYPEFAGTFPATGAAPIPGAPIAGGYMGADGRAAAIQKVSGPATGLMVTAIIGIIFAILGLVMNILGVGAGAMGAAGTQELPAWATMMSGTMGIISGIIGIGVGGFIFFGAKKMKNLESHGLCMGASIIAMLPCVSPCCILGLPFGIWALVVLNKPEVKSQFTN